MDRVEAAAVDALVELTMQLSETKFRPLFYRLTEWAEATPPSDTELQGPPPSALGRKIALFSAANALAEKLRSVFIPYYKALIDPALEVLAPSGTGGPTPKKKAKKGTPASGTSAPGAELGTEAERWQLRLKVVRALHRCFLYDSVSFLDEARFSRLLDPLVAQLHAPPPPHLLAILEQGAEGEAGLEGSLAPEAASLDVFGRAVAACLAQMAVSAGGGDARWRPLNHAVLMASRSEDPRTRLLSLETVAALAGGLREEYLGLLPEALPFLGELLEDVEGEVERRAAGVLKVLEELSGEDLGQYMKA
jgi:U3 small nucleolar RNA-associated protein 10